MPPHSMAPSLPQRSVSRFGNLLPERNVQAHSIPSVCFRLVGQSPATSWQPSSSSSRCSNGRRRTHRTAPALAAAEPASPPSSPPPTGDPILVGINCDTQAAARALAAKLHEAGTARVLATSAANQYNAVCVLATAQALLAQHGHSLHFTLKLTVPDYEHDIQRRSMRKAELLVTAHDAVQPLLQQHQQLYQAEGAGDAIAGGAAPPSLHACVLSATSVRDIKELAQGVADGLAGPEAAVLLEARGEQAVSRCFKALLAAAALPGAPATLLVPAWGQVVDAVAAKHGEARSVPGLVLLVLPDGDIEGL